MSSTCKKRRFVSHGGDIWGFSRKYNIPLEDVLEFSGPINFLGPSPKAVEAVKQNAKLIRYYPDPNPVEFKEEIAQYVGSGVKPVSYTHLRAHETRHDLVCRLLLEKKKNT